MTKGERLEIEILKDVLDANDRIARENRRRFEADGCFVVNLMGAPGSGKTSILERTLERLAGNMRAGVIEGDVRGSLDADRLARFGVPVAQINTDPLFGAECHLDARMVAHGLAAFPTEGLDLVVIENVGNLVCPAEFWVGEDRKVMVLSVAEGDDKPLKYPLMFRESALLLLNKTDLLPYVDFDVRRLRRNVAQVNPQLPVIEVSARTEAGIDDWVGWLGSERVARRSSTGPAEVSEASVDANGPQRRTSCRGI
jgi:hydrogenase nickel incorporation protein HypB